MLLENTLLIVSDVHNLTEGGLRSAAGTSVGGRTEGLGADDHGWWDSLLTLNADSLRKAGLAPDWLVYSGDLSTFKQATEIPQAFKNMMSIAKRLGVPPARVVITPGNHDVDFALLGNGHGLDCFKNVANDAGVLHPWTLEPWKSAKDGFLPFPIDTTALIGLPRFPHEENPSAFLGRLPWWLRRKSMSERLLKQYEAAYTKSVRSEAGYLRPGDLSIGLTEIAHGLHEHTKSTGGWPFLGLVGHHPLLPPPGLTSENTPSAMTIHATLLKALLPIYDVRFVVQGHRHEKAIHEELVNHGSGHPHACLAISAPSLAYDRCITVVQTRRTTAGGRAEIAVRWLRLTDLVHNQPIKLPVAFGASIDLPGHDCPCDSIARRVCMDELGRTTAHTVYYGVAPEGPSAVVVHDVRPMSGLVFVEPEMCRRTPRTLRQDTEDVRVDYGADHTTAVCTVPVPGPGPADVVVEILSVGSHATSVEDAHLLFGEGSREATHLIVNARCQALETTVEFPAGKGFPSLGTVRVHAVPPDVLKSVRPSQSERHAIVATRPEAIRIVEWSERNMIFVRVDRPLPGLAYVITWGLQHENVDPGEAMTAAQWPALVQEFFAAPTPVVTEISNWNPLAGGDVRPRRRPAPEGISGLAKCFLQAASEALAPDTEGVELTPIRRGDSIEVALQICEAWPGVEWKQRRSGGARIQTVAAMVPDGFHGLDRYKFTFRYGRGIVGSALRTRRALRWEPTEKKSDSATMSYVEIPDRGVKPDFLLSVPIFLQNARATPIAVTLAIYNDTVGIGRSFADEFRRSERAVALARKIGARTFEQFLALRER